MQVSRHRSRAQGAGTFLLALLTTATMFLSGCSSHQTVYPAQLLGLKDWKLSVPADEAGAAIPTEIGEPELKTYRSDYFHLSSDRRSVVFRTPVDGAVQEGSEFPRTELREVTGESGAPAAWSNRRGSHTMTVRQAITATPALRPSLVAGQIHGGRQYVVLVVLDGKRLYAKADNQAIGELDADYRLGTFFTLRIEAADGRIRIYYDGALKVDYQKDCEACYFKAGCYLQANPQSGGGSAGPAISGLDFGEVRIRDLVVAHRGG